MKDKKVLFLVIIALIIIILLLFKNQLLTIIYPRTYDEIIKVYAKKYNVDENLILAIIKTESNFDNKVQSHKGAIGLMQLMEQTALEIAPKVGLEIEQKDMKNKLLEEETNINIGTKYLSELIKKYNNTELALVAYNAGTGNLNKWIEEGIVNSNGSNIEKVPFKETNKYVRIILRDYRIYQEIYQKLEKG